MEFTYEQKLEKYKLNLHRDIVAIITDGASGLQKVGRIINIDHLLCFPHDVQLEVIEVWSKQLSNMMRKKFELTKVTHIYD